MTISWTSSYFSFVGLRSRSKLLFLDKFCQRSSDLIHLSIVILPLHIYIRYDNTSNEFAFQVRRVKIKVTVAIFRNTVIALALLFMDQL